MNEQYAALITSLPLFQGFTPQGAQFLMEGGTICEHEPGEILCREGDAATFVLLVLSGKVQVFVEREGKILLLAESGPGTILGELAVLCGIPRAASLRASEKVVVLKWSTGDFRRMLVRNTTLSERIMRQSLRTLIEKEQALIGLVCKDAARS